MSDSDSKGFGIIIPPPEIKAVVDKTAQFVGKNGRAFEQRILNSAEGKTSKFNFMNPSDPFNAYYESKIREVELAIAQGVDPTAVKPKPKIEEPAPAPKPAPIPEEAKKVVASSGQATLINPVAVFAQKEPKPPAVPYQFILNHPTNITPLEEQIIKLTAQHTAVNGKEFLSKLAQREINNSTFDFLKPTHLLFSYFTLLVDSYTKIISLSPELTKLIKNRQDYSKLLEETVDRWNYKHYEEQKKKEEGEKDENNQEKLAFYAIDWNDFSVVATIDFGIDELLDVDLIGERENKENKEEIKKDEQMIENDEDDEVIKVVSDYKPRIATQKASNPIMVLDPVTKKLVNVDQLDEHMRVQLIDPRWREEQKRFQEKHKDTALAQGDAIAENLKLFAKKRGDIFGQTIVGEHSASSIAEEEEEMRKKASEQTQWDGYNFVKPLENLAYNPTPPAQPIPSVQPIPPAPSTIPTLSLSSNPSIPPTFGIPMVPVANPYFVPPAPTVPIPPIPPLPPLIMTPLIPQPPPIHMTPVIEGEAEVKKPRLDTELIPADEFLKLYPNPFQLTISVPSDFTLPSGQAVPSSFSFEVTPDLSIKTIKEKMSASHLHDLAPSKFQLKSSKFGFLKDASTLAALNINTNQVFEISLKVRGGKR